MVQDFKQFPELVWLDKYKHLPGVILAIITFLIDGWPGLIVGFFISTVLVFHITFFINSLTHLIGNQRYLTGDDSRNHWFLSLLTFGEGWHNNHHYYPVSVRQGFFWWEIDISYYILKVLHFFRIVWDLKVPSPSIIHSNNIFSPRAINLSLRFLENHGFDNSNIINQLELIKKQASKKICDKDLKNIREMLKDKLTEIKTFPPMLNHYVKSNLERGIKLLSKFIDNEEDLKLKPSQLNSTIDEILGLVTFKGEARVK
jgi:stearoyl-CoA desaturase (delta-9 desaturase)